MIRESVLLHLERMRLNVTAKHAKFLSAFEKKALLLSKKEIKYIPAQKLLASLVILCSGKGYDKASHLFDIYTSSYRKGVMHLDTVCLIVEHLFFLAIYALPSMVDNEHDLFL